MSNSVLWVSAKDMKSIRHIQWILSLKMAWQMGTSRAGWGHIGSGKRNDTTNGLSPFASGFSSPRLTEMITMNRNGEYKRKITPYYLAKFIENDVISVPEILQGKKLNDLPDRARMFFERMMIPRKTLQAIIEARARGIDVERLLAEASEREGR